MERRTFIAGAAAAGFLLPLPASAALSIGRSVKARGTATLLRAEAASRLAPGADLFEGDTVKTGAKSFAELVLKTATQINLGPDSEVGIDRFVANMGGVINVGGAIAFDRPENLSPLDLNVNTAFARIGVRGTRFFAGPSKGVYAVFVDRGSVNVRSGWSVRRLNAGDGVDIPEAGGRLGKVAQWGEPRIVAAFKSVGVRR